MSNYPPGTGPDDPDAPWNDPEPKLVDCPICGGDGYDPGGYEDGDACARCKGTGQVYKDEE